MLTFSLPSFGLPTCKRKPRGKSLGLKNSLGPKHRRQGTPQRRLEVEMLEARQLLDTGLGQIAGLTDTAPERFVTGLYYDLLYRVPQPAEVAGWANALNIGANPTQVALGFTGSGEYQANFILDDYNAYLGRDASGGEIAGWVSAMQAGTSAQAVSAAFLASGEYFQQHGGTNSGWLNGVYQDLLGRTPDAAGQAAWNQALAAGSSLLGVASAIVNSQEADTRLVNSVYQQLLRRNPDPGGSNTWVSLLQQGMTAGQLLANIAGSTEYYNGQTTNLAATSALAPNQNSDHFDFGTLTSPVAPGYTQVPLVSYLSARGYGWSSVMGLGARNRNFADPLKRDFHYGSDGTFLVSLPNGTCTVTETVGDAGARHTNMAIWANGTQEASGVNTVAGQFQTLTFTVQITAGQLSLRIASTGGKNPTFALDALDISVSGASSPYAVRGIYDRDSSATGFDNQAALGFNYIDSTPSDDFNLLAARGLKGFVWLGGYNESTGQFNESDAQVTSEVSAIAGNPGVGAYFIADEPDLDLHPNAPAQIKARSDLVHSLDPGKPTFVVSNQLSHYKDLAGTVDILGLDRYPISYSNGVNFSIVDQEIAEANRLGIRYWGIIQAHGDNPNSTQYSNYYRQPTPAELDQEFTIWRTSKMEGYLVFAWDWPPDNPTPSIRLADHPELQAQLAVENSKGPISNTSLVATGSTWTYLDNGSDQGTAWQSPGFDSSSWASGAGPLGYGISNVQTVVSYGADANNKYITTYFRASFSVTDPSQYTDLMLRLMRADGAVVYLNGTEVYRDNLPTGTITSTTQASNYVNDDNEVRYYPALLGPGALVAGTNVLAVEVHLWSSGGSDMNFDLGLLGLTTPV